MLSTQILFNLILGHMHNVDFKSAYKPYTVPIHCAVKSHVYYV